MIRFHVEADIQWGRAAEEQPSQHFQIQSPHRTCPEPGKRNQQEAYRLRIKLIAPTSVLPETLRLQPVHAVALAQTSSTSDTAGLQPVACASPPRAQRCKRPHILRKAFSSESGLVLEWSQTLAWNRRCVQRRLRSHASPIACMHATYTDTQSGRKKGNKDGKYKQVEVNRTRSSTLPSA